MIFRRKKSVDADEDAGRDTIADEVETPGQDQPEDADHTGEGPTDGEAETSAAELDVAALDAQEWRSGGPFDITEVTGRDSDGDDEEVPDEDSEGGPRIDLGSMILTGFDGMELRLQMSEETNQIISAMMIKDDSALEVAAFAAPRSGGLWPELREEMVEHAAEHGGSAAMVEGPFGVELRRLLPVSTPDGDQGYQPSRMWVVEGPRWLLRGIVYGRAALEDGVDAPVDVLFDSFRSIIVRRGLEAKAPGDLLPLSLPQNLAPAQGDADL
ncbi:DUF3710 domain-containing protein [Microlunatus panaciterrae]|uniref:DUF3710 domain-containing protein n=1 Tax=Microlunatus panaciterrae TaxID=400768 RepID=A0ABS2RNT4_9ACTN|nr:DUF3710 domain-containing protein [Microlunatus panaciterrae]MBM7800676.1 hypothetical protein [Microlunatus panaciterrae]